MTIETTTARTRRAVLAGGVGAVAAVAVNALARPEAALASDPNDVVLGATNTAAMPTVINNTTTADNVFQATSDSGGTAIRGSSESGVGVLGQTTTGNGVEGSTGQGFGMYGHSDGGGAGVYGQGTNTVGVRAVSDVQIGASGSSVSSIGVQGESISSIGVFGVNNALAQPAVRGHAGANSTGVQGWSGAAQPPAAKAKTGVFGQADQDTASRGVWGVSSLGQGVRGEATTGRGVHGQATSGLGVRGYATTGVGVSAEATTGYALRTSGRVRLDKSAGQATIASGTSSVVVTPGIDLTATSAVVATLNGDAGGSTAVKRVAINATANTFTIYLTGNATASVKAAWIVLG